MRPFIRGAAFVIAALAGATVIGHEAAGCAIPELADRAREANRRNPDFLGSLSWDERQLARIDLLVTPADRVRLWECLSPAFARFAALFPEPVSTYRTWTSDGGVHYFPGNDFSSGKIFANIEAAIYFGGARRLGTGAILVKETFSIGLDGEASLHEIAAMVRRDDGEDEGWRWMKLDARGQLTQPASECLSCHRRAENPGAVFGFAFVVQSR